MQPPSPRIPRTVMAAASAAFLVAALDVVDTVLALLSPQGTGRVVGTLLRDALLVMAGAFTLRRASWARWTLVALLALTLLRVLSADEAIEWLGVALAAAGLALALSPTAHAWFNAPA